MPTNTAHTLSPALTAALAELELQGTTSVGHIADRLNVSTGAARQRLTELAKRQLATKLDNGEYTAGNRSTEPAPTEPLTEAGNLPVGRPVGKPRTAPADTPTLQNLLAGAGVGAAAMRNAFTESYGDAADTTATATPSAEQVDRAATVPAGVRGKARAIFILTGADVSAQIAAGRAARPEPTERAARTPKDPAAAAVVTKARELAEGMKTPIGSTQARHVLDWVGDSPVMDRLNTVPDTGSKVAKLATLKAYAMHGVKPDNDDPLVLAIRAMTKDTGDRLLWGRKAAALLLAVHAGAGA